MNVIYSNKSIAEEIVFSSANLKGVTLKAEDIAAWFKIAVSVTDSDGPETYRSWYIGRVSADMQK